jgi:hypothetical protein
MEPEGLWPCSPGPAKNVAKFNCLETAVTKNCFHEEIKSKWKLG